jgi:hypothetical protein
MRRFLLTAWLLLALSFTAVTRAEPITPSRAHDLATTYMMQCISLCGVVEAPISRAAYWELPIRVGQAAQPAGAIHVDKRSGTVSYRHHPTATPQSLAAWEKSLENRHK